MAHTFFGRTRDHEGDILPGVVRLKGEEMTEMRGVVERITFQNPRNGHTIAKSERPWLQNTGKGRWEDGFSLSGGGTAHYGRLGI